MDLLFNRKVVKPIRGGAASTTGGRTSLIRGGGGGSDSSKGRAGISNQVTFGEFM